MAGRRALVIMQLACEGPGTIAMVMKGKGIGIDFVRPYEAQAVPEDVGDYIALVVMGGPMGVYDDGEHPFIKNELCLIESALKAGVPVLGVCLGAQLLAAAAGARVYSSGKKEIGWHKVRLTDAGKKDRLFLGLPSEFEAFHWHGDTFELPPGSELLASSDLFENQLIRVNNNSYGFQFHIEVTAEMVADFICENSEELRTLEGEVDPAVIIAETPENVGSLERFSAAVFTRFFDSL